MGAEAGLLIGFRSTAMNRMLLSLLLLAVTAIWGWTFSVVKDAVASYPVLLFLAIRFSIASLCLLPAGSKRLNFQTAKAGCAIGLILAAAYLFQTFGLRFTTATNSGLITGLFVVFTPIANRLLFGVRTYPALWVAILLTLTGLAMLTGLSIDALTFGDCLTLGAAICLGVHIALLDQFAKYFDATALALAQIGSATIGFWVFGLTLETISWPTSGVWFALLTTGVVATAVGFFVQTYVQQRLNAIRTALILTLEPVFATIFGYLYGDRLTPIQWCGAALMGVALVLTETRAAVHASVPRKSNDSDNESTK